MLIGVPQIYLLQGVLGMCGSGAWGFWVLMSLASELCIGLNSYQYHFEVYLKAYNTAALLGTWDHILGNS